MRKLAILLLFVAAPLLAQTTDNDNSCDISLEPAATLLLPYFEVSLQQGQETTLFTVQNVSANPQIARVTIWTDYGYPLFTFNLYIGGYGVAPINLYDVLVTGVINSGSPPNPNLVNPTTGTQPNPTNTLIDASACVSAPTHLQPAVVAQLQQALRFGVTTSCGNTAVGSTHMNMIGYATIDVVANCNARLPNDAAYFTSDLLFDNVLTGDYQQYVMQGPNGVFVGNSLVHIRAVPEGGPAGQVAGTNLPFTFYDRLTQGLPARTIDRRQPLPSTFVARWLSGGPTSFQSEFRIWREVPLGRSATCTELSSNAAQPMEEIVRFDEHENASVRYDDLPPLGGAPKLAATARLSSTSSAFPLPATSDAAGWLYFALSNGGSAAYSVTGQHTYARQNILVRQSQAWVVTSLAAAGKYVVSNDAIALGNGCSAAPQPTTSGPQIGPAPNPAP